jgi:hypothetical protein
VLQATHVEGRWTLERAEMHVVMQHSPVNAHAHSVDLGR